MAKDRSSGAFKYENDSVVIVYSFFGKNAPIHIAVQNKLNESLYLDWTKSALVLNNKAVSYSGNKVYVAGSFYGDTFKWNRMVTDASGSLNASAELPEGVVFLPPHSEIERVPLYLTDGGFDHMPDSLYKETDFLYPENGAIKVKAAVFSDKNSPLQFKSYITMYTGKAADVKHVGYEHSFFVSRSIKTRARPTNVAEYQNKSPNIFYTSKATAYGKTVAGVGIATAILGSAALIEHDENTASSSK
ncbi:hypothetical protein [Arcticibacter sp. MXS-1]|uniref:hypothetical protein n=1 Tax=Arcticibacter sp. MXS-1 TaxID=3341726 RepID=UPI0035A9968B